MRSAAAWADGVAGTTLDLDVDKQNELFDIARTAWAQAGKRKPRLATSFWFALGEADEARAQVHRHLRRYMNWIPASYVDAMAPATGWAGNEDELLDVLRSSRTSAPTRSTSSRRVPTSTSSAGSPTSSRISSRRWQAEVMTTSAAHAARRVALEWEKARAELLVREKELTRMKDSVSAARRRLPMVQITESYTFDTENGPASLLDLFDGRRQLIVQHFMFGSDWDEGCTGCSMMADHIGPLSHLHAKDTSLVLVSRAPLAGLLEFRDRMGWTLPWVSSESRTFNEDFRATVDGEEHHAISVFLATATACFTPGRPTTAERSRSCWFGISSI